MSSLLSSNVIGPNTGRLGNDSASDSGWLCVTSLTDADPGTGSGSGSKSIAIAVSVALSCSTENLTKIGNRNNPYDCFILIDSKKMNNFVPHLIF